MKNPRWSAGRPARGAVILVSVLLAAGCSYDGAWDAIRGLQDVFPPSEDTAWLDPAFSDRHWLVFDNRAATTDLVDFPVLVTLTPDRVDYAAMRDNGGADIRFTDSDGVTPIEHDINTWNHGGVSTVWVKVPRIEKGRHDYIWLYYKKTGAPVVENPTGVWSGGFRAVWHLGSLSDATGNGNNGTNSGTLTVVPGVIGNGRDFDGSSYIYIGNQDSLRITGELTLEAWAYRRSAEYQSLIAKYDYENDDRSYMLGFDYRDDPNGPCAVVSQSGDYDPAGHVEYPSASALNEWMHIAAVFGSSHLSLYVNGVQVDEKYPGFTTLLNNTEPVIIGACDDGDDFWFNGILDEARISAVARSDSWIRAQYLSMTDSFITYGPRQSQ